MLPAPLWLPRRATKACTSCRHDKIRCDDLRPCSGCRKKGFAEAQCIDGCEQCRRSRTLCQGGLPCARCHKLRLDCSDDPKLGLTMMAEPAAKALCDRAKTACLACRRDNKKCEDQRPCARCVARSEPCVHVSRGPKMVKVRCQSCRETNKRCEDARPCHLCSDTGKECFDLPRKGKGHGTRVKAACTNCRRDKVRCDGDRPCLSCYRKDFVCRDRFLELKENQSGSDWGLNRPADPDVHRHTLSDILCPEDDGNKEEAQSASTSHTPTSSPVIYHPLPVPVHKTYTHLPPIEPSPHFHASTASKATYESSFSSTDRDGRNTADSRHRLASLRMRQAGFELP